MNLRRNKQTCIDRVEDRFSVSKWTNDLPFSLCRLSYLPAIPSFHLNIFPFHQAPIEFDATVDVIREIHFSYEIVFMDDMVVVDSRRLVSYGWQQMELRRREASFHGSSSSVLLPPPASSVFLLHCDSLREWKGNILPDRVSLRHPLFLSRPVCSLFYRLFLVCSTSMSSPALPLRLQCTLVIRCGKDTGANMI